VTTYTGQSVKRNEDPPLLRGQGAYVDDVLLPSMLHVAFVRSVHAHARITGVDVERASSLAGVALVLTGTEMRSVASDLSVLRRAGVNTKEGAEHPLLANDRVLYVGQPIAMVVAYTKAIAEDAANLVGVSYDPLPALVDVSEAALGSDVLLHPGWEGNIALTHGVKNGDADAAFARADAVVQCSFWVPRLAPSPMECRGVVADYTAATRTATVWISSQSTHEIRTQLGHVYGDLIGDFRVIVNDVGGGFGQKHHLYPDEAAAVYASYRTGRPVKWVEERGENMIASHARGYAGTIEAAVRKDGRILGLRARFLADLGGYHIHGSFTSPDVATKRIWGPYDVQDVDVEMLGVMTNKPPTGPYRGAGQPEVSYCMERAMDLIADQLRLDPAQVRRINLIAPERFPYRTAGGILYDSGRYEAALDRALVIADYAGWREEQAKRSNGADTLLGVGIATITSGSGGSGGVAARSSYCRITIQPDGHVIADSDVLPHGQGMPTTFAQIVADELGLAPTDITLRTGDTTLTKPYGPGTGTYASRSLVIGGSAAYEAARAARETLIATAAAAFECECDDIDLQEGSLARKGEPARELPIGEVAVLAQQGREHTESGGLEIEYVYTLPSSAFSFAVHVAIVEVDRRTGLVDVKRLVAVHDCGPIVNPMIAMAQVAGGVAQGLGEVLQEAVEHDDDGQPSATSFMDYAMPAVQDMPELTVDLLATPSTLTPTRMRGIGEAPSVASPVAVANAVADALAALGVGEIGMPLTPGRVWAAIQAATS